MLIKRLVFISEIVIFLGISTMLMSARKLQQVTGSFHMIAKNMAVTQTR
jgi:hypothetical protein